MEPPSRVTLTLAPPIAIGVLGAALVLAAVAGALQPALRALAVFVLVFPVLWIAFATALSYSTARALRKVGATLPARTHAMSSVRVDLTLALEGHAIPAIGVLTNVGFSTPGTKLDAGPWAEIPIIEYGRLATAYWEVMVKRRGTLLVGPFRAAVELPGSLLRATTVFDGSHTITVLPATYQLQPFVDTLLAGRHAAVGRFELLPAAIEEYFGARDYRPGDSPRLIHRVLSLRTHDPYRFYVREFEDPSRDDLSVVLDTAPPLDGDGPLHRYRLEKAICFVSALCRTFATRRLTVRFVCQRGARGIVALRLRPLDADLDRLERTLAGVDLSGDRATLGRVLLGEVRRQGAAVIFVSLRPREHVEQQYLSMVTLTPDHVPVFTRGVAEQ